MCKIALFGTSADPPTIAHKAILHYLACHYDIVAVWASNNPFKKHSVSLEQRQKMLGLVIEELAMPQNNLYLCEQLSHQRTLHSLQQAQALWGKGAEYEVVIGSDLIAQIHQWYRIEELFEEAGLLVIPRRGYPIASEAAAALKKLGGEVTIANCQVPAASSTAYREKADSSLIPQAVANYIEQEHLYS